MTVMGDPAMQHQAYPNLRFQTATELLEALPEIAEDMDTPIPTRHSMEFLKSLEQSATPEEAITFAAYLLDKRRSVWWGRQCLHCVADQLLPVDLEMLTLAEQWVRQNNDETRIAALEAGTNADTKSPGVWIALGAGWSGGSMTEADLPPVPPPAFLTPRAVNAGVLGALARVDTPDRKKTITRFASLATELIEQ